MIKLKANGYDHRVEDDINRILYNSELSEKDIRKVYLDAIEGTIKLYKIAPGEPYFDDITQRLFRSYLMNKLSETMGPHSYLAMKHGRSGLPYLSGSQ